ncbi:MAG: hypothetical protein ACR2KV_06160, partial [Solirubrobacteraceae bacterium]
MNRFFKSAAFPILIVVVLAFFAQKLIAPSQPAGPVHSYQTLIAKDLPGQMVRSAVIKTKDNLVDVTLTNG